MTFTNLQRRIVYGALDLTSYPFSVSMEGEEWSSGDLVTTVLSSFLQDGDYEVSTRRGNMALGIPVNIEGDDLAETAVALALLAAECEKQTNTLLIDPGDDIAPVTVFETFRATPDQNFSSVREQNLFRSYTVRMNALPHGRSLSAVVAEALEPAPASPTVVSINDGSSTTGWSSTSGTVASSSGRVSVAGRDLLLTQSFSTGSSRYLYFDWSRSGYSTAPNVQVNGDSTTLPVVGQTPAPVPGFTRTYVLIAGSLDVTSVLFAFDPAPVDLVPGGPSAPTFYVDQVSRTDARPSIGTGRQQSRVVPVSGSARTQGSLVVASATTGLGDVLVFSEPDRRSITPALRSYLVGSGTPDAATYSGAYNTLGASIEYSLPGQQVVLGNYLIVARMARPSGAATVSVDWFARSAVGATPVGRLLSGERSVALGTGYGFFPLGTVELPPAGSSSTSSNAVSFALSGATSAVRVDDVYLLNMSTGRLSMVSCGTGTPSGTVSSRLWLNAATVANGSPTILRGTLEDTTDSYYAGDAITFPGDHEFVPPAAKVFLACAATDAEMSLSHFPRWLGGSAAA